MAEVREPVRIAVNVMRARLTALGFNLAIISFQFTQLHELAGGIILPGIEFPVHVTAATHLFLGMALSIVAMVAFIASGAFDQTSTCDHWSIVLGDLLMYLALAQTVAGFFGPFLFTLDQVVLSGFDDARNFDRINTALVMTGATAWVAAQYAGPIVSLIRSPLSGRTTLSLAALFVFLVLLIAWIGTTAWRLQSQHLGLDGVDLPWIAGLFVPLYW